MRGKLFAKSLSMAVLTRAWQLLLKGLGEVKDSPRPLAAADMVLVRLAYAADLPPPDEVLRRLGGSSPASLPSGSGGAPPRGHGGNGGGGGGSARAALAVVPPALEQAVAARPATAAVTAPAQPAVRLGRLEDIVALCAEKRDIQLKTALERDVHLVRFDEGSIEFSLAPGAAQSLPQVLMRKLGEWTGARWIITLSRDPGAPSLKQQADARDKEAADARHADPLVRSVLERFPGAQVVAVRKTEDALPAADTGLSMAAEPLDDGGEDIGFENLIYSDDDL